MSILHCFPQGLWVAHTDVIRSATCADKRFAFETIVSILWETLPLTPPPRGVSQFVHVMKNLFRGAIFLKYEFVFLRLNWWPLQFRIKISTVLLFYQNIYIAQCISLQNPYLLQGENSNFTVEESGRHHSNQISKVSIVSNSTNWHWGSYDKMNKRKTQPHFCDIPPKCSPWN